MPQKQTSNIPPWDVETITAETAVPYLLAGAVFTFYSLSRGWYCAEKKLILPCPQYDKLRQKNLVDDGRCWSPEQEQERQASRKAQANKNGRLQHYYDQLTLAFECGGTRQQRVFAILEDIWSKAGSELLTDNFEK